MQSDVPKTSLVAPIYGIDVLKNLRQQQTCDHHQSEEITAAIERASKAKQQADVADE